MNRYKDYDHKYDDLDMDCKKCGASGAFNYHSYCEIRGSEHLHYSCSRCGYEWTGDTLDNKREKEAEHDRAIGFV